MAGMPDMLGALLQVDRLDFSDSLGASAVDPGFAHFVDEKTGIKKGM